MSETDLSSRAGAAPLPASPAAAVSQHTPGPWRSQGWVPTWAYIPVHDARHNLVASLYPDSAHNYTRNEVEANARLIAAAPKLLEALRGVLRIADEFHEFCEGKSQIVCGDPDYECPIGMKEWVTQEDRDAIAKAHTVLSLAEQSSSLPQSPNQ